METKTQNLRVAEYTLYPGPRYCNQGDCSGEDFYHSRLNPAFTEAIEQHKLLTIDLDGTAGYASSFLDEAFGNLVYDFTAEKVKSNIEILSKQEPDWIDMIVNDVFVDWEQRRLKNQKPKKTVKHPSWFRFEDTSINKKT